MEKLAKSGLFYYLIYKEKYKNIKFINFFS